MRRFHLLGFMFLIALVAPAHAHNLGIECKLRGKSVEVEAFYDDDTPAKNARVEVLDPGKKTIIGGRTDADGRWSFPVPPPGIYQVVVNSSGHRDSVRMTIPDHPPDDLTVTSATQRTQSPRHPSDMARTVSEGATREEFTRFPWTQGLAGLGIIALLALGFWAALRLRRANV